MLNQPLGAADAPKGAPHLNHLGPRVYRRRPVEKHHTPCSDFFPRAAARLILKGRRLAAPMPLETFTGGWT